MIETIINLRDRAALAQAEAQVRGRRGPDAASSLAALESQGRAAVRPRRPGARASPTRRRWRSRPGSTWRSATWPCSGSPSSAPSSAATWSATTIDALLRRVDPRAVRRALTSAERSALVEALAPTYADRLAAEPLFDDVSALVNDAVKPPRRTWASSTLGPTCSARRRRRSSRLARPSDEVLGDRPADLFTRVTDRIVAAARAAGSRSG